MDDGMFVCLFVRTSFSIFLISVLQPTTAMTKQKQDEGRPLDVVEPLKRRSIVLFWCRTDVTRVNQFLTGEVRTTSDRRSRFYKTRFGPS
jgi:hypothetical protein